MMLKSRCQWCVHCQCGTLMNIADVQTSHYQERFIHVVVSNKWVLRGTMKANIIIKIASGLLPIPTYFFACHFTDDQKANRLSKDRRFSTMTLLEQNKDIEQTSHYLKKGYVSTSFKQMGITRTIKGS